MTLRKIEWFCERLFALSLIGFVLGAFVLDEGWGFVAIAVSATAMLLSLVGGIGSAVAQFVMAALRGRR